MDLSYISEEDFARTYGPDAWEIVEQYREARRLSEEQPELARAEIARRVNRSQGAVRGWLAEDKVPSVVQGIRTARDRGWIEVDSESEQFRALNQLVAWVYSGGGIQTDHFVPYFSVDDELTLSTLTHLLRWLTISYRYRNPDDSSNRGREVVPAEGASALGRVLSVLGAPIGVKATHENLDLPAYLSNIDEKHRRDFARVHLLNRGSFADGTAGTNLHVPIEDHRHDLRELFESVTSGTATVSQPQFVWVSAAAVRDLAGSTPVRSALATRIAHGTIQPPTDRAFASTYRPTNKLSGYGQVQLYRHVQQSDQSASEIASTYPVSAQTIWNWRNETQPYVQKGLDVARERGWIPRHSSPAAGQQTQMGVTALLAWILAKGTLRDTYYPAFGCSSVRQRETFDSIATAVGFPYKIVAEDDSDRSTELRPTNCGNVLGRILYALGVPRSCDEVSDPLVPPYLYHHPSHARRFVEIWWLHHATDAALPTLSVPPRFGEQFPAVLETLLTETLDYSVDRDGRQLSVPDLSVTPEEILRGIEDTSESS